MSCCRRLRELAFRIVHDAELLSRGQLVTIIMASEARAMELETKLARFKEFVLAETPSREQIRQWEDDQRGESES